VRRAFLVLLAAFAISWGFPLHAEATPPALLSQTGLYSDIATKSVATENLPYEPQYPLWSDGAEKQRWLYLPPGTKINNGRPGAHPPAHMGNMDYWIFPVGTKIWKEFTWPRLNGSGWHRVETRFAWKAAEGNWQFATYVWDDNETDAKIAPVGGLKDIYPIEDHQTHDIPAQADCITCHNRGGDMVLGIDPLQLSEDRDPMALHAVTPAAGSLTLRRLAEMARLTDYPTEWSTTPLAIKASTPEGRAAMGYLHGNCGNCHNPNGTAAHSWLYFRYSADTTDEQSSSVFVSAINRMSAVIQIPGQAVTLQIKPGAPDESAVIYAMENPVQHHMPPIGSKIIDEQAVALIRYWIQQM